MSRYYWLEEWCHARRRERMNGDLHGVKGQNNLWHVALGTPSKHRVLLCNVLLETPTRWLSGKVNYSDTVQNGIIVERNMESLIGRQSGGMNGRTVQIVPHRPTMRLRQFSSSSSRAWRRLHAHRQHPRASPGASSALLLLRSRWDDVLGRERSELAGPCKR